MSDNKYIFLTYFYTIRKREADEADSIDTCSNISIKKNIIFLGKTITNQFSRKLFLVGQKKPCPENGFPKLCKKKNIEWLAKKRVILVSVSVGICMLTNAPINLWATFNWNCSSYLSRQLCWVISGKCFPLGYSEGA